MCSHLNMVTGSQGKAERVKIYMHRSFIMKLLINEQGLFKTNQPPPTCPLGAVCLMGTDGSVLRLVTAIPLTIKYHKRGFNLKPDIKHQTQNPHTKYSVKPVQDMIQ